MGKIKGVQKYHLLVENEIIMELLKQGYNCL